MNRNDESIGLYLLPKWLIGEYFETWIWLIHFFIGIHSIKWFILKLNETRHFVLIKYAKLCALQVKINGKWCIPQDFLTKFGNGGHSGAFENIPYMLNTNAKYIVWFSFQAYNRLWHSTRGSLESFTVWPRILLPNILGKTKV